MIWEAKHFVFVCVLSEVYTREVGRHYYGNNDIKPELFPPELLFFSLNNDYLTILYYRCMYSIYM